MYQMSQRWILVFLAPIAIFLLGGCSRPLSPSQVRLEVDSATDRIVRFRVIENPVPLKYVARADVSRSCGVVHIKLFQESLHSDPDRNVAIPELSVAIYPSDREIRLTDGIDERVVWVRSPP